MGKEKNSGGTIVVNPEKEESDFHDEFDEELHKENQRFYHTGESFNEKFIRENK